MLTHASFLDAWRQEPTGGGSNGAARHISGGRRRGARESSRHSVINQVVQQPLEYAVEYMGRCLYEDFRNKFAHVAQSL